MAVVSGADPVSVAAVFPLVRTHAFAESFDYEVPAELHERLGAGALVAVPLGPQTVVGVVLEVRGETRHEGKLRAVHDVLDVPPVPAELLEIARHVRRHYLCSLPAALALVSPHTGALRVERRYVLTAGGRAAVEAGEQELAGLDRLKLPAAHARRAAERYRRKGWLRVAYRVRLVGLQEEGRSLARGEATPARLGARQRAALEALERVGSLDERSLRAATGLGLPGLRRLLAGGAVVEVAPEPPPLLPEAGPPLPGVAQAALAQAGRAASCATLADLPDLLTEQRAALHTILCETRPGEEVLVHGVTGSGKTEVYLQAVAATLDAGRSALLLVPEIALTGQTVARVRRRFEREAVAVLHSGLSAGDRLLAYRDIAAGRVRLVVGARSAVFAPLRDLGLIVVDEEHDTSYKQENEPHYDARTVARWRAQQTGAVMVAGSATPSVETYATVPLHVDLQTRVDGSPPPPLEIVDLRDVHDLFSPELAGALTRTVDAGEKAILFHNRRGYAGYLACGHCGHAWDCPRCDVSLTLFGSGRGLRCRTCGHAEDVPTMCPSCGSLDVARHGFGTERVQREVEQLLPGVELLRLDSDVAASYGRLQAVLQQFAAPGPKVLVGTQMIAKGHHFPEVTLVGVIDADVVLHFPDFRAEERTFAMLVQVGGRSGRGGRPGRVIVQTLSPEARSIVLAASGEDERFYADEVDRRRELGYPPATSLVGLELSSPSAEKAQKAASYTAERLGPRLGAGEQLLGPGPLVRERARYQARLLIKTPALGNTLDVLRPWVDHYRPRFAERSARLVVDVEPQWL
jgi:primosomal protein N' (replication factor Y) (superfamily II helicase)